MGPQFGTTRKSRSSWPLCLCCCFETFQISSADSRRQVPKSTQDQPPTPGKSPETPNGRRPPTRIHIHVHRYMCSHAYTPTYRHTRRQTDRHTLHTQLCSIKLFHASHEDPARGIWASRSMSSSSPRGSGGQFRHGLVSVLGDATQS